MRGVVRKADDRATKMGLPNGGYQNKRGATKIGEGLPKVLEIPLVYGRGYQNKKGATKSV